MIKLIAFDLDGTLLLDDHQTISEEVRNALSLSARKGVTLVPATGRLPKILPKPLTHMHGIDYAVCANGALVYDLKTQEVLFSDKIAQETAIEIMEVLKPHPLALHIFSGTESYMDHIGIDILNKAGVEEDIFAFIRSSQTIIPSLYDSVISGELSISKVTLPVMEPHLQESLWKQLEQIQGIAITSSLPHNIEINSKNANKALGLEKVCKKLKIHPNEMMAIGDSLNDIEMIQFAGIGVAMGNADAAIQKKANFVTDTNQNNGLAKAIEKFVLTE